MVLTTAVADADAAVYADFSEAGSLAAALITEDADAAAGADAAVSKNQINLTPGF